MPSLSVHVNHELMSALDRIAGKGQRAALVRRVLAEFVQAETGEVIEHVMPLGHRPKSAATQRALAAWQMGYSFIEVAQHLKFNLRRTQQVIHQQGSVIDQRPLIDGWTPALLAALRSEADKKAASELTLIGRIARRWALPSADVRHGLTLVKEGRS